VNGGLPREKQAQIKAWKQAVAASRRQQRNRRGKRKTGLEAIRTAGMARLPPQSERPRTRQGRSSQQKDKSMVDLSDQDAAKVIELARSLHAALLPVLGAYDDGTLPAANAQAWKDADADTALRKTRDLIDRALTNLERAP
jgi:hypothetical protein